MDPQNQKDREGGKSFPDHYGTGRPLAEHSATHLILALLSILLGANLITAGILLSILAEKRNAPEIPVENGIAGEQRDPESRLSPEALVDRVSPGVVSVSGEFTGLILDEMGYILTGSLPDDGRAYLVELSDGRTYCAQTVGMDAAHGISLLKIEGTELSPAPLGESVSFLEEGELYLLRRDAEETELEQISQGQEQKNFHDMNADILQIQCGDGSLVLNSAGEIVGIGLGGIAVPIQEAVSMAGELALYGSLNAPESLGMEVSQMDGALCAYWNLPGGVVIGATELGGRAAEAGLCAGDVILQINGEEISDLDSYWQAIGSSMHHASVTVSIYRSGAYLELELPLQ